MKTRCLILTGSMCAIALAGALLPVCLGVAYPDSEAAKHVGDEATVTGKVVSISRSAKGTAYLNFGDRFPRQTFSGVVFSSDVEKVGNLSAFEGKTVSLTGRIELSPGGKPQIVIRSADQLKLAPPAADPAPAPATPPAPASLSPNVPEIKRIALAENWAAAPQTGEMTRKDLATLFGSQITPASGGGAESVTLIYPGVPYLTPLTSVRQALNLGNTNPTRAKITTPGLPVASLTANTFTGIFPGGYTSLTLVCDANDQVASVYLVDENPRQRTPNTTDTTGYHTYNFIADRRKGSNQVIIKHAIVTEGAPAGVVVVESMLIDPDAPDPTAPPIKTTRPSKTTTTRQPRTGKVLERSRWYVPKPLVEIILRASGNR